MMKYIGVLIIVFCFHCTALSCCTHDSRSLTEFLFNDFNGTIFTAKVLSFNKPETNYQFLNSDGSIDATAKIQITEILFGEVDSMEFTIDTQVHLNKGLQYLFFPYKTENGLKIGVCEARSKEVDTTSAFLNEIEVIKKIAKMRQINYSGIFELKNHFNKTICEGQYENGLPVGVWKHYYPTGYVKSITEYSISKVNGSPKSIKNGVFKEYHRHTELKASGYYKLDRMEGDWSWYDENGNLKHAERFVLE